jgi:hypothetical protein
LLFPDVIPFLETAMDVSGQEHLHSLREPLIARVLMDSAVELLHVVAEVVLGRPKRI